MSDSKPGLMFEFPDPNSANMTQHGLIHLPIVQQGWTRCGMLVIASFEQAEVVRPGDIYCLIIIGSQLSVLDIFSTTEEHAHRTILWPYTNRRVMSNVPWPQNMWQFVGELIRGVSFLVAVCILVSLLTRGFNGT